MSSKQIRPNSSWKDLDNHYMKAIEDPWYRKIAEVNHLINIFTYEFYEQQNIKSMYLPITTGSISSPMGLGSDSSPVKINLCGVETYLADSMQFMLEYGCRFFSNGCYYIMPSFRGELADERHLCQFYHSEAEIPGKLEDVMLLVEKYVKYLSQKFISSYKQELEEITGDISHIANLANLTNPIPRVTLDEAEILLKHDRKYIEYNDAGFKTINKYGEQKLISIFNGIVWLTHNDHISVPFYQAFNTDKSKAQNADLLFGIGEVVGSGERHYLPSNLHESLNLHNVSADEYEWYIKLKTDYQMQTSGFGMGIERFILWLFKHYDIRDCQILPRFNGIDICP